MRKSHNRVSSGLHLATLTANTLVLFFILSVAWADDYSQLKGYWQCQEDGQEATLEFISRQQMLYNGQAVNYQLAPGAIQVQEDYGLATYLFTVHPDLAYSELLTD